MARDNLTVGKATKVALTALSLLVLVGGLMAGVMDTKVRVNVLEKQADRHIDKAANALEKIQEGIHKIDREQMVQGQQLQGMIDRQNREHP